MNLFRIKNTNFKVVEATFKGHLLSDFLIWSISISAEYSEGRLLGEEWKPRVYSDRLITSGKGSLNNWEDLLGQTLEWESNHSHASSTPFATLYVFEHLDVYNSRLEFGNLTSPNRFTIKWAGKCDVWFGKDFTSGLDLQVQTQVEFLGIESPFQNEARSTALLRDYIPNGDFTFDSGDGAFVKPIFRPRK